MNKLQFRVFIGLFLLASVVKAQPTPEEVAALKNTYPNARAINLVRNQVISIKNNGAKPSIKGVYHFETLLLDDKIVNLNERSISYAPGIYEIKNLEASTLIPQEKGYKKVAVKKYTDEGNLGSGGIFYDGVRYKRFFFPGVTYGAITQLDYEYQFFEPNHIGPFYFYLSYPAIKQVYTVEVGNGVEIGYKLFGDSSKVTFSKEISGNKTIYRWECNNINEVKSYGDAVNFKYFEPHVYVYIIKYMDEKGKEKKLFSTPEDLYKYEFNYIKNTNKDKPIPLLAALIDSINTSSPTREDKIKNTYYWVQQHIKYIAFEDGLGGQIPREANDVFTKRFGDCKDLASLITFMLNHMGVEAYLTWIGTRDLPYTYQELPLGYASNHMIATVFHNNKWVFIDGTSKHTAFGIPSEFIQGKEALIALSPDSFVIKPVEMLLPEANKESEDLNLKLINEQLVGSGTRLIKGYNKSDIMASLYYSGIDKQRDVIEQQLYLGNNKCKIEDFSYNDFHSNDSVLQIKYSFTLPDYVRYIDDEVYVNLHLRKIYSNYKIDTTGQRKAPRKLDYAYEYDFTNSFQIPDGYTIKKIPSPIAINDNGFNFQIIYTQQANKIIYRQVTSYNKLMITPEEFNDWNNKIDMIIKNYKELLVLKKIK